MSTDVNTPLTDDDFQTLDTFLLAEDAGERLGIDEAHGYLTAVSVAHQPMPQQEWLKIILGESTFSDDQEAQKITVLLQRMFADISTTLKAGSLFEPLIIEEEEEGVILESYEGWCFGFMLAVTNEQAVWDELPENEQDLLAPIAKLAMLHIGEESEEEMDEDEYDTWVDLLPGAVASLYTYWDELNVS